MTEELENLIELVREDILTLEKGINEQEKELKEILDHIKIGDSLFSIDLNYFGNLVNKYAFKVAPSDINNQSLDILKRIKLVEKIFFTKNIDKTKNIYTFDNPWGNSIPNTIILIYKLYYAIFKRYILSSEDIVEIFKDLLDQWNYTFNELKIPITFITHLPLVIFKGNYQLIKNLELKSVWPYIRLYDDPGAKKVYDKYIHSLFPIYMQYPYEKSFFDNNYAPYGVYLFFKTEISNQVERIDHKNFKYIPPFFEDLKEEFNKTLKNFYDLINVLYLYGYDFKFEDYTIEYPWWWYETPNLSKFETYYRKYNRILTMEKKDIEELQILYNEMDRSSLYLKNKIIANRYFQVYNRESFPDIILDSFIILEILLTRGKEMELSYRLSLNGALFLARDWSEFKRIKNVLKHLYDLRSKIIHGGNWEQKVLKLLKNKVFSNENDIIIEVKAKLNRILRKLIKLQITDKNLQNKLSESNFFFDHSNIMKR